MNSATRAATALLAIAGLAVTATGTAQAATGWRQAPDPVPFGNILAMAQLDPHTTWAAGFQVTAEGRSERLTPVLLAHDDRAASTWQRIATPADAAESRLNAISAAGARNVWLVGDSAGQTGAPILTEHWDGAAWRQVAAPAPADAVASGLLGVATVGPRDAWAVGWAQVDIASEITDVGLLEHWDGTAWRPASLPAGTPGLVLTAVTALNPHDVWAAGYTADGTDQPLLLHFDGRAWTRQAALPNVGLYGEFNTVVGSGPHDIWAAGRAVLDDEDRGHPLLEHFDGHSWKAVPAPGTGTIFAATPTPGGVTVVGYDKRNGRPYGERLDASGWHDLGLPAVGIDSAPCSVAVSARGVAVGGAYDVTETELFHPLLLTATR